MKHRDNFAFFTFTGRLRCFKLLGKYVTGAHRMEWKEEEVCEKYVDDFMHSSEVSTYASALPCNLPPICRTFSEVLLDFEEQELQYIKISNQFSSYSEMLLNYVLW
jgi:hypothetical protein